MRILLVLLCLTVFFTGNAMAGDTQARRIEQLEQENYRLSMRISELQDKLNQERRIRQQTTTRYGTSYRYGTNGLSGINRSLRELEQAQRSVRRLSQ